MHRGRLTTGYAQAIHQLTGLADKLEKPGRQDETHDEGWAILKGCHRWFAVEIESIAGEGPRYEMPCRVIASSVEMPFFGLNRSKHAVIEAAILATRTHLIDATEIDRQLETLRPLIDKTAGDSERRAFELLCLEIDRRIDSSAAATFEGETTG